MSDTYFVVFLIASWAVILLSAFAVHTCAYRNGVADGYRAAKFPNDVLNEKIGVNKILRSYGLKEQQKETPHA